MIIWFEGEVGVPKACRNKERTITMRVKPVIINMAAGMNVNAVINTSV